jgi:tripartite-type tricarboxylate transporter receptor subunit TctC
MVNVWFEGVIMKHLKTWLKVLTVAAIGWASSVHAQTYPNKTLRIIEPAGPGSAVDVFARKLAPALAERLGQAVVVDNKPGGNSAIGAREAARSPADGYTLLHANINNSLNDLLLNDPCCKLNEALQPVILLTSTPLVMVVHPSLGVKNLVEYQAWARANPDKATFASGGSGSVTQMIGTKINMITGLKVLEVPYKAIGAELPDLMAGHVSTAYLAPVVVAQLIKSGKLVALGVAGARRVPIIAEVPTLTEQGLSGAIAMGWNGLFVPAGTPKAVIHKLQTETAALMATPTFVQDAKDLGYELGGGQAEEFAAYIKSELDRWGQVIREAKLK